MSRKKGPNNRKRPRGYSRLFDDVISSYIKGSIWLGLSGGGLQSSSCEIARRRRPAFRQVEYLADVERSVLEALEDQTHLLEAFNIMLRELAEIIPVNTSLSLGLRAEIVRKCGKLFACRGLQPNRYFAAGRIYKKGGKK